MSRFHILAALSLSLAACMVGSGSPDQTSSSVTKTPKVIYTDQPVCFDPIVDINGDGIPDGLDLDCDGTVDIWFNWGGNSGSGSGSGSGYGGGGGGGGNVSSCQTQVSINGDSRAIQCSTSDGTDWSCNCSDNGTKTTCTTTSSDPCSIPGGGNCCGF